MFQLPNGAKRSPDASWVRRVSKAAPLELRWNALSQQQQDGYPPLCPDFVIELRSPTDRLEELQAKMREYMENGSQLGWLINPQDSYVEVYRTGQDVEVLRSPVILSGEDVLPGFVLRLDRIWQ